MHKAALGRSNGLLLDDSSSPFSTKRSKREFDNKRPIHVNSARDRQAKNLFACAQGFRFMIAGITRPRAEDFEPGSNPRSSLVR